MNAEKGSVGLKINALKDMTLETVLADGGKAQATIVVGDDATHARLADRIVKRIEGTTGARLPVIRAEDGQGEDLLKGNVLILGNMADNALYRWLYHRWWAIEDLCYPGGGGYALRTLHDPLGNGSNAVLIAASDATGLERGVSRFLDLIPSEETLRLGWLMEVQLGAEFGFMGRPPAGWLQERRDDFQTRIAQPHASKAGAGYQLVSEAASYGLMYHRTGIDAYAEALREAVDAHLGLGEHGVMAHFNVWWFAVIWDLVEESPVFSDEDRLRITRYLLWIMDSEEGAYNTAFRNQLGHRMVRQNHQTLVALSSWFAGRYFSTHYGIQEGEEWMEASADVFKGQAESFKPIEDANGYQWTTLDHLLTYTLASGDRTYVENGNCRRSLDQAVFYCNNLGSLPAFGDTSAALGGYPTNFLVKAGHVLRDGRAAYLLRKRFDAPSDYFRPKGTGGRYESVSDPFLIRSFEKHYHDGIDPVVPEAMAGVTALEVAEGFYRLAEDPKANPSEVKPLNLPREEAFDTVCFREGFGRDDQYLMLHGIGYGNHSHEDGNTISEFSANDRIFLVDASYTEGPTLKHHNGVTAVRDGEAWQIPALCRLDGLADLGRIGFSRTSMDGEWGARWTRSIVWLRGRSFVVIDDVVATQAGQFTLQCHWRALGGGTLEGDRLEVVQRDPDTGREDRFVLQGTGGDRVSLEKDWENFGHWWESYPYAEDIVSILSQSTVLHMAVGDRHTFSNLFYASNDEKPVVDTIRPIGPTTSCVAGASGSIVVGTGDGKADFELGPVSGQAQVYAIGEGWFALCNGTALSCEETVFESDRPVSLEMDLATGEGVVVADAPTRITVCGQTLEVEPGRHEVHVDGTAASSLPTDALAGPSGWDGPRASATVSAEAPELKTAWTREMGSGVRSIDAGDSGIAAGTEAGEVVILDAEGQPGWRFKAEGAVNSVCLVEQGSAGPLVAAGSDDRRLYLLDGEGKPVWSREFALFRGTWDRYARNSAVERVLAADLGGQGQTDILAAVSDRQLHCFDLEGNERWSFMIYGIFDPLRVADLDGDGRLEVIGGPGRITCGGSCYVLDADGRQAASHGLDGWASMMPACDVWVGAGSDHLVASGTTRSNVFGLKMAGNRLEVLWKQAVGEEVRAMAVGDVSGDGRPEVAAGSDCFYLYLFSEDGTEQWRRNLGAPVERVLLSDLIGNGRPEIVAGCEDGSVWVLDGEGETIAIHRTSATIHALIAGRDRHVLLGSSDGRLSALSV